ncbi:MAG: D-alanyl-D-alaninecarboxypeptidase/D-alanyl-D-alanine-endopeptidase [Frankiales bacterium]|nr:D-alanyl-D-alaninecarboxypeptidase/D-alanyl-D-alanine-endopeptidase [Frankiales bacterium]
MRPALLPPPPVAAAEPSAAGIEGLVAATLAHPAVAGRLSVSIVDVATGRPVYERAASAAVLPASTVKIVTAVAVLSALPADQRLSTTVVAGALPGEVVLVGGGDPTLTGLAPGTPPPVPAGPQEDADLQPDHPLPASLQDLAAQARGALGATAVTRVVVDESLFSGERTAAGWKPGYVTEDGAVAPVGALMVDGGRLRPDRRPRHTEPALAAGRALASLLAPGAEVAVEPGRAAPGATRLGEVRSPPVADLVERMLTRSDNDLAEALARHVAIARGQPATFAGASVATMQVLALRGVQGVVLADGSGLSRLDRVTPAALTRVLAEAASGREPRLAPVLTGLPVAGFVGTLSDRYRAGGTGTPGAGNVRAKTGTLNDVSALAGLLRTADGRLLAFDLTADGVPLGATRQAEAALDALATGLAACGCR